MMESIGALCLGAVIGWITYRTLRRKKEAAITDIGSVVGAIGGAAVTAWFGKQGLPAWYCIGLAGGFLSYFIVGGFVGEHGPSWMMQPLEPPKPGVNKPVTPPPPK